MIIADTNLVSYLLIEGERTPSARDVRRRDPEWVVPPLWRSEFLSVLTTAVRSGVIAEEQALSIWWNANELLSGQEQEPSGESVLTTALQYKISAYDAHFVVLAADLSVPLVTSDRDVAKRCPKLAVTIEDFASELKTEN